MKAGLIISILIVPILAFARIDGDGRDKCIQNGGTFDAIDGCVEKPIQLIRKWREAVDNNEHVLFTATSSQCERKIEPNLKGLKAISLEFSNGAKSSVIPAELHCAKANDKFSGSETVCTVGYYRTYSTGKRVEYYEEKVTYDDSPTSSYDNINWANKAALKTLNQTDASFELGRPGTLNGMSAACQFVKAKEVLGPSSRGGSSTSDNTEAYGKKD